MIFKEHWPTNYKLSKLRNAGQLPYSSLASSFFVLGAVLLTLLVNAAQLRKLVSWSVWLNASGYSEWQLLAEQLAEFVVLLASISVATYILSGLLQNLFFFKPGLLSFRADRFKFKSNGNPLLLLGRALLIFLFGLGCSLLSLYFALRQLPVLLDYQQTDLDSFFASSSGALLILIGLGLLLGIVFSVLGVHLVFRVRHRMSHEDYKAELQQQF